MSTICRRPPPCTICTLHYALYILHCLRCALCSVHCALSTICTIQYTLCTPLCTMHYALVLCTGAMMHCFIYSYSVAILYNLNTHYRPLFKHNLLSGFAIQLSCNNQIALSYQLVLLNRNQPFCHLASEIAK